MSDQQPPGGKEPLGYPASEPARSAVPMWVGALIGLLLTVGIVWGFLAAGSSLQWPFLVLVGLVGTLISVPVTRRWGIGILIGAAVTLPLGLIVFAGVCLAWVSRSSW